MLPSSLKLFLIRASAAYLFVCGYFYFFQHLLFFHPRPLSANYQFSFSQKFEERQVKLDGKTLIDIVQFVPKDSVAKGVVLYFHGNRKNIERYAEYAPNFTKHGYECWMVDYPGYGKSTGEITKENMQQAATELYKMARAKYPYKKITIYGKSLGTGLAAWLASVRDCSQLILETPYYSLASLSFRYVPFMPVGRLTRLNFTTSEYLKNIIAPVIIFHGLQDEVIPFTNAMQLIPGMKKGDRFIPIPGGKHNDLPGKEEYQAAISRLFMH